jgi:hypothetical protein
MKCPTEASISYQYPTDDAVIGMGFSKSKMM